MKEEKAKETQVSLTGKCTSCFSPDGVLVEYGPDYDYLCSKCAERIALHDLAGDHLEVFMPFALTPWKEHWLARGVTPLGLADVFDSVAYKIREALQEEARATVNEGSKA